jgi:origin recognition complex subunit 1
LEKIVQTRLQSARDGLEGKDKEQIVISSDGIKFAAMKVSSISGDARRVLDICRFVDPDSFSVLTFISDYRRTVELVQPLKRTAKTDDVKDVIKVMQNSPTAAYLHDCSLHERMMLAALLKVIKREGIEEVRWGDVSNQLLHHLWKHHSTDHSSTIGPAPTFDIHECPHWR